MFRLSKEEYRALRFQFGSLKRGQHSKYLPRAFTEQGVAMLSSVLRSDGAVQVNIAIMRAFVRLREILASHKGLARKMADLEQKQRRQGKQITEILVIHFTLVMNQAILGLALLAAKTESVERRFSKTSGGGSLNGLPASKLAASICSVSAGQRGSFVRTARPRRVGRPDEARCSVAGADARPLPRREPSCTTRGCRCGVGFWPCGWSALRKQG